MPTRRRERCVPSSWACAPERSASMRRCSSPRLRDHARWHGWRRRWKRNRLGQRTLPTGRRRTGSPAALLARRRAAMLARGSTLRATRHRHHRTRRSKQAPEAEPRVPGTRPRSRSARSRRRRRFPPLRDSVPGWRRLRRRWRSLDGRSKARRAKPLRPPRCRAPGRWAAGPARAAESPAGRRSRRRRARTPPSARGRRRPCCASFPATRCPRSSAAAAWRGACREGRSAPRRLSAEPCSSEAIGSAFSTFDSVICPGRRSGARPRSRSLRRDPFATSAPCAAPRSRGWRRWGAHRGSRRRRR